MSTYDIRVVRLIKSTQTNPLSSYLMGAENIWVCLGHFDIAIIDQLTVQPNRTPLQAVQEDSMRLWNPASLRDPNATFSFDDAAENNYVYPLYAIRQIGECPEQEPPQEDFWNIPTNFLAVTRLHCDRGNGCSPDCSFPELLVKRLMQTYPDFQEADRDYLQLRVEIPSVEQTLPVSIRFYESLELGDVIGFIKCNSISTILQIQRTLYEAPCVSDAYSYCGIHNRLFQPDAQPFDGDLLKCLTLEYVSTRFSVKLANCAEKVYPVLLGEDYASSNQHFFVVGNADTLIDWKNCSEWALLEQLRKIVWLDALVESPPEHPGLMYQAFYDVITRIGLKHRPPRNARPEGFQKSKSRSTIQCPEAVRAALMETDSAVQWHYPLVKLLGTLQTMSDNSVMDDLSSLLIPGVNALLKRIEYFLEKRKTIGEVLLLSFLDACSSLVNDILHLENQLVQHPELMPVRYFIPAIVLGFEQKFISECACLIESLDSKANPPESPTRSFQPIIFPSCETNTSTRCYFDHKLDPDYTGETPLAIYVPVSQLYQPWEVLHILCHEVAHYCGDTLRNRDVRYDCIINSAAEFVLQWWQSAYQLQYSPSKKPVIDKMQDKLARQISKGYRPELADADKYLDPLRKELPRSVSEIAASRVMQEEYLYDLLAYDTAEAQVKAVATLDNMNSMRSGIRFHQLFQKHLERCLISHYKECYADIVMILFLNCEFQDYYECVYGKECMTFLAGGAEPSNLPDKMLWEYHTDRLALVVLTMQNLEGYESWFDTHARIESKAEGKWAEVAAEKVEKWKGCTGNAPMWFQKYLKDEAANPYKLTAFEVQQLLKYLNRCSQTIVQSIGNQPKIQPLRDLLEKLKAENFDWRSLRNYLER